MTSANIPAPQTAVAESGGMISIQEVWQAAGGNANHQPSKEELLEALLWLDKIADDPVHDRVHELQVALSPFAALSQEHQAASADTDPLIGINSATITHGDVRRAAKTLESKSPRRGWNLISRCGLPANNPLNDANTVEVEIFDPKRSREPAYWVCCAVFWHKTQMWHIVGGGATTVATHWRYKTYPEGETTLPVGTPIRFTKDLTAAASGDHPGLMFASAGEEGLITGHGTPEGYWVKSNHHPNSFGASPAEFEVLA